MLFFLNNIKKTLYSPCIFDELHMLFFHLKLLDTVEAPTLSLSWLYTHILSKF